MRRIGLFLAAVMLVLPAGRALAADAAVCEAARCAFQEALNEECPCDQAKNHGKHVSCVAHVLKRLSKDGTIPKNCRGKIQRCAARSICGKEGFVACQIPTEFGVCATPCAADPLLTCCEDATTACAVDTDCVLASKCKIKSSEERCTAAGGAAGEVSTCCADCAAPTPNATPTP